jgi:hypothetical protein
MEHEVRHKLLPEFILARNTSQDLVNLNTKLYNLYFN